MKKALFFAVALVLGWLTLAQAQVWVAPHVRRDGTYVPGHFPSTPDSNPYNNWSYPGNTNPYTGNQATGDPNRYLERYRHQRDWNSGGYNPYSPYGK